MRKHLFVSLLFLSAAATAALELQVKSATGDLFGEISSVPVCGARATCLLLDGTTPYCGATRALWIFDVSKPLQPRLLGVAKGIGNPRQIAAENGMVYVGARETGVWIIDARNPVHPKVVNRSSSASARTASSSSTCATR